jgi:hypothetical protein
MNLQEENQVVRELKPSSAALFDKRDGCVCVCVLCARVYMFECPRACPSVCVRVLACVYMCARVGACVRGVCVCVCVRAWRLYVCMCGVCVCVRLRPYVFACLYVRPDTSFVSYARIHD